MTDRQLQHHEHKQASPNKTAIFFLLHDIESPSNVGAIFRCADALGCQHIYLSGSTAAPPNRKLRKASRSAELHVSYSQHQNYQEVFEILNTSKIASVALELSLQSEAITDFQKKPNSMGICIIPGSENHGLDTKLLNACEAAVHIPMRGKNSSMNLATACAIAAYQLSTLE
ncbi:TrmH family RNA methyltransferase [uncultured Pseudoteredinibacter sp.]|uniref:TrmH family RNA methyltransferase n=1 Tax=uncultured Pseudoteredinibacter sp. TaxID=1641701 RepID=UPI00262444F2|nr:TrmH family RNA methyltransferase [uncultured Pseudoteredinibacter sp.]